MKNRIKRNLDHLVKVQFVNLELQDHFVWVPKKKRFFGLIETGGYLKDTRYSQQIYIDSLDSYKYVVEKFGNIPMVYLRTHLILTFSDKSRVTFYYKDDELAEEEYNELIKEKFLESDH